MPIVFVVLTVVLVVAIGLVSVGRATATLAAAPPPTLFDFDEAVEYVAEHLPYEVSARLSYDDVRALLGWHLDYLEAKGVAAERVSIVDVVPAAVHGEHAVVAEDDEGVAYVLGRAGDAGLEVDDPDVVDVIQAEAAYLAAIGAIGAPVSPDEPL